MITAQQYHEAYPIITRFNEDIEKFINDYERLITTMGYTTLDDFTQLAHLRAHELGYDAAEFTEEARYIHGERITRMF